MNCRVDKYTYKNVVAVEINKARFEYENRAVWYVTLVTKEDKYDVYAMDSFQKCVEWVSKHCEEV